MVRVSMLVPFGKSFSLLTYSSESGRLSLLAPSVQEASVSAILGYRSMLASWRSNSVSMSFYFKDLQFVYEGLPSLGPFIAAGE